MILFEDSLYQKVTFQKAGTYQITAYGAGSKSEVGYGAIISGKFYFKKNSSILIAFGEMGKTERSGSGGTFVTVRFSNKCKISYLNIFINFVPLQKSVTLLRKVPIGT